MTVEHCETVKAIRLYKAGKRTIIEIDGADECFEGIVLKFLSTCLEKPVRAECLDVELAGPLDRCRNRKEYQKEIVLTDGAYKGVSATEALQKDGEIALVTLYEYARVIRDGAEKEDVCEACKHYMATVLKEKKASIKAASDMETFIRTVAPLIDSQKLLRMFTYGELDDFIAFASYDEKRLAFEAVINSLIRRGMQ